MMFPVSRISVYVALYFISEVTSLSYGSSSTAAPTTGGTTFPTSNNGCLPNVLPNGTVADDATKRAGKFYEYRSRALAQQSYNTVLTNALVGDGLVYVPGTTTKAVHFAQQYTYVNLLNGTFTCHGGSSDIIGRYDGVYNFLFFDDDSAPNVPIPAIYFDLYDDQSAQGFHIQYTCDLRSEVTGKCVIPEIYVNTREDPSQMSADRMNTIDAVIDRILKPYCLSKDDLQLIKHDRNVRSDCQNLKVQEAFNGLVAAFTTFVPRRTVV